MSVRKCERCSHCHMKARRTVCNTYGTRYACVLLERFTTRKHVCDAFTDKKQASTGKLGSELTA